ncbi:MAG: hypothetical protein QXX36_00455 [Candidatus Rehaiarchaeum fermentans]|nr:hypothetical protein [Candidatus Rehaiarchaeum fermentans]
MRAQYAFDYLITLSLGMAIIFAAFSFSFYNISIKSPSFSINTLQSELNGYGNRMEFPQIYPVGSFICNNTLFLNVSDSSYSLKSNYLFLLPLSASYFVANRISLYGNNYITFELPVGSILTNYVYNPINKTLYLYLEEISYNGSSENYPFNSLLQLLYFNYSIFRNVNIFLNGSAIISLNNVPDIPFILRLQVPPDNAFLSICLHPSNSGLLLNITNSQYSINSSFQQIIKIPTYYNFINQSQLYVAQNVEFQYANGSSINSWFEGTYSSLLTWWIKLSSLPHKSIYVFLRAYNPSISLFNGVTVGEAPQLSPTYGEYDNGANVFLSYLPGYSLTGWTTSGTAGVTNSAPSGNPIFGSHAFYANGSKGDYLYTIASSQSNNMIIEYYGYTANLQDLYFLVNSTGFGQMARDGNGAGWYGITNTYSWTNWNAPPDTGSWSNEWVTVGVVVNNGVATMYLTPGIVPYGSEIGSNPSNSYTVTDAGNYLGLVGDAANGATTQYWNGIIIRAYPPNGVMPSVSIV